MAAIQYDFKVEAGAGHIVEFVQTNQAGDVLPFTAGTTAEFQARVAPRASGSPLLALVPTVDHAAGKVTLHMSTSDTRAFDLPSVDSCVWAIELHTPGADDQRFAEGKITCSPEVVRP